MKISKSVVTFIAPIILLIQLAVAQQPAPAGSSALVSSPRPLVDAARILEERYGKVVTYEEPVLTWRGELDVKEGHDAGAKWQLFPKEHAFRMPDQATNATDLANELEQTIGMYHQQTSGTRFHILSSKLGLHIVPVQMHDENGRYVPAKSALDQIVTVPTDVRTAKQHLLALGAAISSTGAIPVVVSAAPNNSRGFDNAFRAQPEVFQWGATSMIARDALIDLLDQSATTFSWQLMCQPSAQPSDRICTLNVGLLEVAVSDSEGKPVTDSAGKPVKRILAYDRR